MPITNNALDPIVSGKSPGQGLAFYIAQLWKTIVVVGSLAFLLYLVWGGIEWITSTGDKAKAESAQKRISNALVGLAIVAASWAVWNIILYFFGINIDTLCSPNPLGN